VVWQQIDDNTIQNKKLSIGYLRFGKGKTGRAGRQRGQKEFALRTERGGWRPEPTAAETGRNQC
jgi:hypothetical protein